MLDLDDVGRIGPLGVAHPDPGQPVALDHRVGTHVRSPGNTTLVARCSHTGTVAVEHQAVVTALHPVVAPTTHGQGKLPVWTGIRQRGHRAVGPSEQADVIAKNGERRQVVAD